MKIALMGASFASRLTASVACLLLGSLFSVLLAAYTLSGRAGIARLAEKYPKSKQLLARWAQRWDYMRSMLLLCSAMLKVGALAFAVLAVLAWQPTSWPLLLLAIIVTVFLIILAWEILPRALSKSYADRFSVMFLPLVSLLTRLGWVFAWPLRRLEYGLSRRLLSGSDEEDRPSPEDAIRSLVSQADSTDLEEEEREIIKSVFEFGETVTREIMTPRVDIEGLEDTETTAQCVARVTSSPYSRFPVFHENMDDVQGVVHVKDLLKLSDEGGEKKPVMSAVKPVPFVPESMPINDLLQLLRTEQTQMAIVVDEYGGTAGLVTVEDILEELVGEIQDEYDAEEMSMRRLSDGSAILNARVPVDEANEFLGTNIPTSEEYDSLGGYVFHALERIPRSGETIEGADFRITVQTANARQIHALHLQKKIDASPA